VIELGAGNYSTPILHEICEAQRRTLKTYDNNAEWLNRFKLLESDTHKLNLIASWDDFALSQPHGLAFVDHADIPTNHARWLQCVKLIPTTGVIVIHDTEDSLYGYDKLIDLVDVIDEDTRFQTHTRVIRRK